jgi:hypothetical protein
MKYSLSVLVGDTWLCVAEFEARDHADAYLQLSRVLPPEYRQADGISIQPMDCASAQSSPHVQQQSKLAQ